MVSDRVREVSLGAVTAGTLADSGSSDAAFSSAEEIWGVDKVAISLIVPTLSIKMGAEDTVTSKTGTSNINELTGKHVLLKKAALYPEE